MSKISDFNPDTIRGDFPILQRKVHGQPLIYFDNGATTQKPRVVIETMNRIYEQENSSIHRGVHHLSDRMTEAYEEARNKVKEFIGAAASHEIVFTSGTTGSINAIATSFGEKYIGPGDEVLVTVMEHHANLVPWQMLCERKGAHLRAIPLNDQGELMLDQLDRLLTARTRILAVTHVSNTLGTINPVKNIVARAHERNIPVLVDGAQAVQHLAVDVTDLDCDFYVFSGHKVYGPTGIGILYGKEKWLEDLPPYQYGGDMVDQVSLEKTTFHELPLKFEAGTTNYVGAIGMGKALEYLQEKGLEAIAAHEHHLVDYGMRHLQQVPGLRIYGMARQRIATFSILLENTHPYDVGMILDKLGIAVRTGTHCAQPVMQHFGIEGTLRASLAMYNTTEEIDRFIINLETAKSMLT